jgi:hypothetical protein
MKLTYKFEVISINKITYEDSQKVKPNMLKAIDDDTMFNTLTAYKPTRGVGAQYINDKIQLSISNTPISAEINNELLSSPSTKIDLNGTLGYCKILHRSIYKIIKARNQTNCN